MLRLAQRLLLNREAARDASQEVFLRLYRKLGSIQENRNLEAWLYRTTVNICFDALRRAKPDLPLDLVDDPCATDRDPEQSMTSKQQSRLVLEALRRLTPRERSVIALRELEGYSTAEVAEILRSSEGTVRSQISSAKAKLRAFLDTQKEGQR